MTRLFTIGLIALTAVSLTLAGCNKTTTKTDKTGKTEDPHDHDTLVWDREDIELAGFLVDLGAHGDHVDAGHDFEPAVIITKDGADVSDAEVFVALVAEDKTTVLAEEAAMEFEPKTDDEPAHYASAKLRVPNDATKLLIRYRIILPGGEGETYYSKTLTAH